MKNNISSTSLHSPLNSSSINIQTSLNSPSLHSPSFHSPSLHSTSVQPTSIKLPSLTQYEPILPLSPSNIINNNKILNNNKINKPNMHDTAIMADNLTDSLFINLNDTYFGYEKNNMQKSIEENKKLYNILKNMLNSKKEEFNVLSERNNYLNSVANESNGKSDIHYNKIKSIRDIVDETNQKKNKLIESKSELNSIYNDNYLILFISYVKKTSRYNCSFYECC